MTFNNERVLTARTQAHASADGDGVQIKRIAGFKGARALNPFLMLDELKSDQPADYIGGFPPHPHRGFETITYLKAGKLRHQDHLGNSGLISDGGAQWMVAGSGVIHSEMPEQTDGLLHGFQLWLNLPAAEKMQRPSYRDLSASELPELNNGDTKIRVLAGSLTLAGNKAVGPITRTSTEPLLADIMLGAAGSLTLPVAPTHQLYLYVYQGSVNIAGTEPLHAGELGYLGNGDLLQLTSEDPVCALLIGGLPIDEPVAHYGPFVMNTQEEIEAAVRAYNEDRLTD